MTSSAQRPSWGITSRSTSSGSSRLPRTHGQTIHTRRVRMSSVWSVSCSDMTSPMTSRPLRRHVVTNSPAKPGFKTATRNTRNSRLFQRCRLCRPRGPRCRSRYRPRHMASTAFRRTSHGRRAQPDADSAETIGRMAEAASREGPPHWVPARAGSSRVRIKPMRCVSLSRGRRTGSTRRSSFALTALRS